MKTDFLGWVFFSVRFEASLKKNPTPWGFSRETPPINIINIAKKWIPQGKFFNELSISLVNRSCDQKGQITIIM